MNVRWATSTVMLVHGWTTSTMIMIAIASKNQCQKVNHILLLLDLNLSGNYYLNPVINHLDC
jgi:hypothetical protein